MHSCCHTHQLQPQRLLTQARHLRTVQSVSQSVRKQETAEGSPEPGTGKVRDSRCGWEKLSNRHAVIEGEGGVGDHHSTKPELHSHRDMVCKMRREPELKGGEGWGPACNEAGTPSKRQELGSEDQVHRTQHRHCGPGARKGTRSTSRTISGVPSHPTKTSQSKMEAGQGSQVQGWPLLSPTGSSLKHWGLTGVWRGTHHTRTGQQSRTLSVSKVAEI